MVEKSGLKMYTFWNNNKLRNSYERKKWKDERRKEMFCKYCGQEIAEGEVHECEKKPAVDWKGLALGFLKNPMDTMRESYGDSHVKERFLFGGVYYVVLFLSILAAVGKFRDFGDAFVNALVVTLVFMAIKVVYAGFLFFFGKENGNTMEKILSQACLATLPQTVCILAMVIFALLGFYVGMIVMLAIHLVIQITLDMVLMECVFGEKKNFGYWMYLVFCTVLICILYIVLKSVVVSFVENLVNNMMSNIF